MNKYSKILFLAAPMLIFPALHSYGGELRAASIFSDNMVLQRNSYVPVWGTATPGQKVSVTSSWEGASHIVTADKKGKWKAVIPTADACENAELSIISEGDTIKFEDVMLGDVWLASGQSNMSMPIAGYTHQPVKGATDAILSSGRKKINFVNIPPLAAYRRKEDVDSLKWEKASPATTGQCSAVAWFFADRINSSLDVPIGIINASFSGSNIEAWMPEAACKPFDSINVPAESDETSPWIGNVATLLYNGMINPIAGYGIKGMLWYQGESNIFDVPAYEPYFTSLVKEWRNAWGQGEWPLYFVQIAPYDYKEWNFFTPQWPEISAYMREAQLNSSHTIPNAAMAVTLDVGSDYVIHPPYKKEVGERLALLALAKTYGLTGFEAESPEYDHMEVKDGKAILHFSKQHNGLTSYGKPLTLFEISGDNKVFVKADAYINDADGTVVVSSRLVSEPKAVRYAFKDYVEAELFGTGGLPVSSFRTDDWN